MFTLWKRHMRKVEINAQCIIYLILKKVNSIIIFGTVTTLKSLVFVGNFKRTIHFMKKAYAERQSSPTYTPFTVMNTLNKLTVTYHANSRLLINWEVFKKYVFFKNSFKIQKFILFSIFEGFKNQNLILLLFIKAVKSLKYQTKRQVEIVDSMPCITFENHNQYSKII